MRATIDGTRVPRLPNPNCDFATQPSSTSYLPRLGRVASRLASDLAVTNRGRLVTPRVSPTGSWGKPPHVLHVNLNRVESPPADPKMAPRSIFIPSRMALGSILHLHLRWDMGALISLTPPRFPSALYIVSLSPDLCTLGPTVFMDSPYRPRHNRYATVPLTALRKPFRLYMALYHTHFV